jgi:hypothetical protein
MTRGDGVRGRGLSRAAAMAALGLACFAAPAQAIDIQVDTGSDASAVGICTLREAIEAATDNNNAVDPGCEAGGGTLDRVLLGTGGHVLTGAAADDGNVSGDLDVDAGATPGPLEIVGQGAAVTLIDCDDVDRAIHLLAGTLTVRGLRIEDCGAPSGNEPGGAIRSSAPSTGTLALDAVQLSNNTTPEEGGAVATSAGTTLTVTGSTINLNRSEGDGGGVHAGGPMTLTSSTVTGNRAVGNDGGGLSLVATTSIDGSTVSTNTTDDPGSDDDGDLGGGINFEPFTALFLTITNSTISGNSAELEGGGAHLGALGEISMSSSTVSGNSVTNDQVADPTGGAGLALADGSIDSSTVRGNTSTTSNLASENHGGILKDNSGVLAVRDSTVNANIVSGGVSQEGGGISSQAGTLNLVNSTISDNTATKGGGLSVDSIANVISTTFGDNHSDPVTGIHSISDEGTVNLRNSIIYDFNGALACTVGGPVSQGGNVAVGTSCINGSVPGDLANTDAQLLPLASNGGPTQTHGIPASSPAVNRVPTAACVDETMGPLTVDQRGLGRPSGGACDSGALELQPGEFSPTPPPQAQPAAPDPACKALRKKLKKAKTKKAKRKLRKKLKKKGC